MISIISITFNSRVGKLYGLGADGFVYEFVRNGKRELGWKLVLSSDYFLFGVVGENDYEDL